jgi:hypothetical protein
MKNFLIEYQMLFFGLLAGILTVTTAQSGVIDKYISVGSNLSYVIAFIIWSALIFTVRAIFKKQ